MSKTYLYVFIIIMLIMTLPVSADSLSLTSEKDNVAVAQGKTTSLSLSLFSSVDDRIILSIKDSKPWMSLSDVQPRLNASENRVIELRVSPDFNTMPGVYKFNVIAVSQLTGDRVESEVYVSVLVGVEPIAIERLMIDGDFNPYTDVTLNATIRNGRSATLHDLQVKFLLTNITGGLVKEYGGVIDTLPFNSTIDKMFTIRLAKGLAPGAYRFHVEIYEGNDILYKKIGPEFVVKTAAVFDRQESAFLAFVGIGKKVVIENAGNIVGSTDLNEDAGFLSFLYTGTAPQTKEGSIYKWTFALEPSQSMSISYYINWLPIIVVVIVLAIFIWYLLAFVFTVKIHKKIMRQKKLEDGARFTIGIEVHNETLTDVNDVVIRDFVPDVFVVDDTSTTIKPIKKRMALGTELIWKFNSIRKGDARVVSYGLVSKIGVSGSIRLASANVRYKYKGLRLMKESNFVNMGSGGEAS